MWYFRLLLVVGFAVLSACRTSPLCPEPFEEFPPRFQALQRVMLPKLKFPIPLALAKINRNGRNWDVTLMEPFLQTPLVEFHKRGFWVTHETPLNITDEANNLDKAFMALRYFYESDDFVCAGQSRTLEVRGVRFILSHFRGEGACRFPAHIEVRLKDGSTFVIETLDIMCYSETKNLNK